MAKIAWSTTKSQGNTLPANLVNASLQFLTHAIIFLLSLDFDSIRLARAPQSAWNHRLDRKSRRINDWCVLFL